MKKKNFAFTLAEVLITLGVIGVVAAITLSNLIKNYQKLVWVNQLKSTYSILEQGFQKMMADDGVDNLSDTTVFQSMNQSYCWSVNNSNCTDFWNNFKRYIKVAEIKKMDYKIYYLTNSSYQTYDKIIIKLQNGAFLFSPPNPIFYKKASTGQYSCEQIKNAGGNMCDQQGVIYIDVNGNKEPNRIGRDIFLFYLGSNGRLFPWFGKDHQIYGDLNFTYRDLQAACNGGGSYGLGCAARIIQNGWKMDY